MTRCDAPSRSPRPCSRPCSRSPARAGDGGRVNGLKVLSDKVDDVTTVEQIVKSFVKPGMTDQQRAEALWRAAVKYRHQQVPANEYLDGDEHPHDPVKVFNVYGYCQCCCSSAILEALNREDGREARGRILNGHSVPEVRYRDAWHMFDASLITYFPRPDDGVAASVDEIAASVADWYAKHPGYRKNPAQDPRPDAQGRLDGLEGRGPAPAGALPVLQVRLLPARGRTAGTRRWPSTTASRRSTSTATRSATAPCSRSGRANRSSARPATAGCTSTATRTGTASRPAPPRTTWRMCPSTTRAIAAGSSATASTSMSPNLAAGDLALGAEVFENLAVGAGRRLKVKDRGRPGVIVVPMTSPYVYLGGDVLRLGRSRTTRPSRVVDLDLDGRRADLHPVLAPVGDADRDPSRADRARPMDRPPLRLPDQGRAASAGRGSTRLEIENDIQHAPRTLPRLEKGKNTITVSAGLDPTIATRTDHRPDRRRAGVHQERDGRGRWASRSTTSTSSTTPAGGRAGRA